VKQFTILVTPDGQWVLPDTPEFFAALGDPNPDYDAVAFAVKNLGFIRFQVIEHSIVEIELHPRNVELSALLAVQQQLLSSEVRLFRVKYFNKGCWNSEISSSVSQVIERLSELCANESVVPSSSERYLIEPMDFTTLFDDENRFRGLAQKWRVSFGHFDPTVISIALRHQLLPRLIVAGIKRREGDPFFRFIGDGHRWVGHDYHAVGVGQKVANQPDKDYGEWVSEYFKSVAVSGKPRYDMVTADLRYEDETGRPRRKVRYERLLLPWKTPSEEVFVTSCTAVVDTGSVAGATHNSLSKKLANSV
jgi:hypothetical protein